MSNSSTGRRRRLWAAAITAPLLLVASCTGSGAESSPAPAPPPASSHASAPPAPGPSPSAATASAPATLPPGAFTSKLQVPRFTGSCPATTIPPASGRTVVIPLHILTPSAVISQLFVGVCLNGHGPYPFIIDTGSNRTYVDVALAQRLKLISAAAASRLHTATCNGPAQRVAVRLSAGPYVFGQEREVLVTDLASPSAPLMGILGAAELSSLRIDRIDYRSQTLTVPAPTAGAAALASLSAGTVHRIRLHPNGAFQLMPATAGNARGELLLDTGAQGTTLTPAFARQARLAKASSVTTQTYAGLGCTRPVTYYATTTWSVGGVALAPQTVGVVPDFLVADGSLGSGTLQRYTPVVIDYQDEELLLGPLRPGR
jgi:predicted aspartyl protease